MLQTWAVVRFRFEGMHLWKDAIPEVEFLKHPHRHIFHVEARVEQRHYERDVEYVLLRKQLVSFVERQEWNSPENTRSCETMAHELRAYLIQLFPFRGIQVSVFEDGENGAMVGSSMEYV